MSRVGKQLIVVPKGVRCVVDGGIITVQGPKGTLTRPVVAGVSIREESGNLFVDRDDDSQRCRTNHGLMRALLANMVRGVSTGFERRLEIVGVGYKAEIKGKAAVLNLGYSHQVEYPFPEGITISVEKNTKMLVTGIDRERVGQVAAELRGFRPPDSYKGKGVRVEGERIRIKAGKSGQK